VIRAFNVNPISIAAHLFGELAEIRRRRLEMIFSPIAKLNDETFSPGGAKQRADSGR
jgi:hypothetical protein